VAIFEYRDEHAEELHRDLIKATDGTEPCFDPYLANPDGGGKIYESPTDKFVENYANRGVSSAEAKKMCDGCHVLDECREYAMYNGEPFGIWGGTTPRERGFYRGKKIKNKQTGVWE
jgi:hypothetical protein